MPSTSQSHTRSGSTSTVVPLSPDSENTGGASTEAPRFSSSEEVLFKTCRLAHHFKHDLGYAPRVTNRKLSVGIAAHAGVEAYYLGEDWGAALAKHSEERWQELTEAGLTDRAEVRTDFIKDRDLASAMVKGYIEWTAEEGLDDDWDVVSVEEQAYVELPYAPCLLPIKLDLLQRHKVTGLLRIVDLKTRKTLTNDLTGYQLAEQTGNYALGILALYGEAPTSVVYREARKIIPSGRSKPPYFQEVAVVITHAELMARYDDYIATAKERFDPDRSIVRNPSACCGSWKNDWQTPCLKVAAGMSPIEALETSTGYASHDPYERYKETIPK